MDRRGSGILLHITSLPSKNGMGNMGPDACRFVDFLSQAGQSHWQVLPLNPPSPGEGNSPYSSSSAFAGNVLLISPEMLASQGLIGAESIEEGADFPKDRVEYKGAIEFKERVLDEAYRGFKGRGDALNFELFSSENSYWLFDYALFAALKKHFHGQSWASWPTDIRDRKPEAIDYYSNLLAAEIEKQKIQQYLFYGQWTHLKKYTNDQKIKIVGDLPIYMSYQSADVWAHPDIFKLDDNKKPLLIAGVPPDYFSKTGQLWGNPVYNWDRIKETNFDWWIKRVEHNLRLFDILRIDHFRGLVAYWEVAAGETTAINGKWIPAPGEDLFNKLKEHYPALPIIAEDLGVITDDVKDFITRLELPGMKVLLFAFGEGLPDNLYAPHNHIKKCVVYTGTHDNNTIRGWFDEEATAAEKLNLARYLGHDIDPENISWDLVRLAMTSVADLVVLPMQDILGLGSPARMNTPSTTQNNWEWRLREEAITPELIRKLRELTQITGRL